MQRRKDESEKGVCLIELSFTFNDQSAVHGVITYLVQSCQFPSGAALAILMKK